MIRIQFDQTEPISLEESQILAFKSCMDIQKIGDQSYSVIYQNRSHEIMIHKVDMDLKTVTLSIDSVMTTIKMQSKMDILLEKMGIDTSASTKLIQLKAPMPGLVVEWFIQPGDHVEAGDKLLILEAMKMENVIKASGQGVVKKINVVKGTAIEKNQVLIEFA